MAGAAAMAEWLRRWTRNPMGFPRAGSNPARSEFIFCSPVDQLFLLQLDRKLVKVS